jgi:Outer membrane protein beta-barrel domain
MPENNFEKQVQQKMNELHFVPSAVVWQEVEKQISERKRRRVLFIWLPFLVLMLGGAFFLYYSNTGKQINKKDFAGEKKSSPVIEKITQKDPVPASGLAKNGTSKINIDTIATAYKNVVKETAIADNNDKAQTIAAGKNIQHNRNPLQEEHLTDRLHVVTGSDYNEGNADVNKNNNKRGGHFLYETKTLKADRKKNSHKPHTTKSVVTEDGIVVTNTDESKTENNKKENVVAPDSKAVSNLPEKDTAAANNNLAATKDENKDSAINTKKQDSAAIAAKNKVAGKKKKIEWGINVNAGVSNISQSFSRLLSNTPAFDLNYLSSPTAGTNNSSPAGSSGVKPGFGFAAGIFISKSLGKNVSLLAGLNYNYLSTSLTTGGKIDTGVSVGQYRPGSTATYTNRFHFIEVPVMIEKQLGSLSRFSIEAGVAFSLLAGSNALQYDGQKNIYYVDNSYINKAQWSLQAGFNYRLLQKKIKLEIGPQFNYGINKFFKKELYGSRHLFFAGVSTRIFLGKK